MNFQTKRYLGIDPGNTTGWALIEFSPEKILDYGIVPVVTEYENHGDRINDFYNRMIQIIKTCGPDFMIQESMTTQAMITTHESIQYRAICHLAAAHSGIASHEINPMTVKAFMGSGRLTKTQVRKAVSRVFNITLKDIDVADAAAVALAKIPELHYDKLRGLNLADKCRFILGAVTLLKIKGNTQGKKGGKVPKDGMTLKEAMTLTNTKHKRGRGRPRKAGLIHG